MPTITCQYGDCLEQVGEAGIVVTLKTKTFDGEKRASFCSAGHAAAALNRLATDRKEQWADIPRRWRVT